MSHDRRVFVPLDQNTQGADVLLPEDEAHHLRTVVRLRPGDPITIVDSTSGEVYPSFVSSAGKPFIVKLGVLESSKIEDSSVRTLLFALCKNRVNDIIAEKATELGVDRIIFWQAERSIVRYSADSERMRRAERLQKIAAEASKQSARKSVPDVRLAQNLEDAIALAKQFGTTTDRFFYGSLSDEARALPMLPPLRSRAHVLIGPEGDLTAGEEAILKGASFEPITLGTNRLRSETAACAAITAIDIFGRFSR